MSTTLQPPVTSSLSKTAAERVAASNAVSTRFFESNANLVARACQAMAARFAAGGRLLVCGDAAQRSDVAHVVVEFVHPVVVGKRALPAMAIHEIRELDTLARSGDILMLLTAGPLSTRDAQTLEEARGGGLLTLALSGPAMSGRTVHADFQFAVDTRDPAIVQESHEMLYHVLWELVHVFLDHRG